MRTKVADTHTHTYTHTHTVMDKPLDVDEMLQIYLEITVMMVDYYQVFCSFTFTTVLRKHLPSAGRQPERGVRRRDVIAVR